MSASAVVHRLIDVVTHPLARFVLDRKWFPPAAYGSYHLTRFILHKLIYQPFIRPFRYLRLKPRYEELHPQDEVTLPRNAEPAASSEKPVKAA